MNIPAIHLTDCYKQSHQKMYPPGTTEVYSNLTARSSRVDGVNKVVFFGLQYFLKRYLIEEFNHNFFNKPKCLVIEKYCRRLKGIFGVEPETKHLEDLHDLGYLPVQIKALPEGSLVPLRIPLLTIKNTHPRFPWITNFIETMLSASVWLPITSATTAYQYKLLLSKYAKETSDKPEFVSIQAHDFSMRGHSSLESSSLSGMAHLTSFTGTDTIPAIDFLEEYYGANAEKEVIGVSIPASEHSVSCIGGKEGEYDGYRHLLTEVYPKGPVSLVLDSYDYYKALNEGIRSLRDVIMSRDGICVVRPDSGDPVKIICGNDIGFKTVDQLTLEDMGTVEILWNIFGGTINSKGYKQLDSHIGVIYGDSITLDRARLICEGLKRKGFSSTNIVFGVGSYTYQYVTRDTYGLAFKATSCIVDSERRAIYKDPVTDDGTKRSAKGLLMVFPGIDQYEDGIWRMGDYKLWENVSEEQEKTGCLQTVFLDGSITKEYSLHEVRQRLQRSR